MNKVILIGNVTKDVELSTSSSGTSYTSFNLAVRRYSDQDGNEVVDFHTCVAFSKLAENLAKHVKKGHKLGIIGELQNDTYVDSEGKRRTSTKVVLDQVEFLTPKSVNGVTPLSAEDTSHNELTPTNLTDEDLPF